MAEKKAKATRVTREKEGRFIGWQKTPIHQAMFGRSTVGGRKNMSGEIKHSTGDIKEVKSSSWWLLDASQVPVGRIATTAATLLTGKHKATFTPGADSGDGVIIINADKAFFTSDKNEKKIYYRHTQWMGGLKSETAGEALEKHPDRVFHDAVWGMLSKNSLSRRQLSRLKVVRGAEHPYQAQKPTPLNLETNNLLKKLAG